MADEKPNRPLDHGESTGRGEASEVRPGQEAERYVTPSADKTREELEAAKAYAEMIVNTIREALLVLDLDLRVQSASRSFYATFKVTREETEGRLVYELGNGQWDIPELRDLLENILPKSKTFDDFEVQHQFEEIGHRVMLLNGRQINHHGLILLAIEDITERRLGERRLRASQERFDLLVQNAKEYAIFLMDDETRITMWNPGAERILGWNEDEILGQHGEIIFTAEDRKAGVPAKEVERARDTGSSRNDRWHVRSDGSRFWATGFMVALRGNRELRGFAKILRDDTRKKKTDKEREALLEALDNERRELRKLNETLEERVKERTKEVRMLASTLTMAEQAERRRISQILHDDLQQILYGIQLKLTYIRRDAEAGERDRVETSAVQIERWLRDAISTTRRLTVDLSPPLLEGEGLTDALSWLARQMKEVHDLDVDVRADHSFTMEDKDLRVLLFQVVRELLFNVVKHAGIRRAAVELEQIDGHAAIRVIDEGEGFDVDEAARRSREERGGGLGLFGVRERLDLFGGRMEIESAPGEGTRVTVYTPAVLDKHHSSDDEDDGERTDG